MTQKKIPIYNSLIIWNELLEFKKESSVLHALTVCNIHIYKITAHKTLSEVTRCL